MKIWVDADACPGQIREILFRAARRTQTSLTLVANHPQRVPPGGLFSAIQVPKTFDAADHRIAELCEAGDLVITADIPLADSIVAKGATGLNPRGELYTEGNIKDRLAMRNLMAELRSGGMVSGGPSGINAQDKQTFANALDRFLARGA